MSLNDTVSAERTHIAFFGMRNAGKSSLVNAVTGQQLSIVSEVKGTTTDPVKKAMEILPLGPVVIIDTPGIDDEGELGKLRVQKAIQVLDSTNIAVLVSDATRPLLREERELLELFQEKNLPHVTVFNKCDLLSTLPEAGEGGIYVSAKTGQNVHALRELLGKFQGTEREKPIARDLLSYGERAILVVPIDSAAPKGRLILPQQQTIRDLLEGGNIVEVVKDTELELALKDRKSPPKIVITDSQVFGKVSKIVPENILLTSFSILMARYKGSLLPFLEGAAKLKNLQDGDRILISEGCSHHRQCEDIGTVKIPKWLKEYTGKELSLSFTSGGEFPTELKDYSLVIHCGACMLNEAQMKSRVSRAREQGVPIVNYGMAIAQMHGILKRSLSPFPDLQKLL